MFPFGRPCRKLPGKSDQMMVSRMNPTLQHCPPWTLRAWPPILWQVSRRIPSGLHHIDTQVTAPGDLASRTSGQTLWAWRGDEGDVGMAWDWVQIAQGVVAVADPLGVVTNLRLVGEEGEALHPVESARLVYTVVHGLPWQREVERALERPAPPRLHTAAHRRAHHRSAA